MRYYELKMTEGELRSFSDYLEELRYFADDDQPKKKKSHFLRNAAIGTGLAAGALFAGNKGWLGTGMQRFSGNTIASAGSLFGSRAITNYGTRGVAAAGFKTAQQNAQKTVAKLEALQKSGQLTAEQAKQLQSSQNFVNKAKDQGFRDQYVDRASQAMTDRRLGTGKFTPEQIQAKQKAAQQAKWQRNATNGGDIPTGKNAFEEIGKENQFPGNNTPQ